MGGRTVRREPLILVASDEAREILARAGWIAYFMRFQPPNEEIAIEFLWNLQNGQSVVRGRQITVSDALIAEVSGLLAKGPVWARKRLKMHDAIEAFKDEGQEIIKKGKGVWSSSLGERWGNWHESSRIISPAMGVKTW